ncbi:hypothetical protein [Herbiconiux sp. A18JL235]|uniref:Bacterial Ig-like domain-containing protein n=1 Tax=Herbiconiux sp. A18JL235 TaxID=3152363 RepID=A0AB39BJ82_9MICO
MFRHGWLRMLGAAVCASVLVGAVWLMAPATSTPSARAAAPLVSVSPPAGSVVALAAGAAGVEIELAGSDDAGSTIRVTASVEGDLAELCETTALADESWNCTLVDPPDFEGPATVSNGTDSSALAFGVLHAPTIDGDPGHPGVLTSTISSDTPTQTVGGGGHPGALLAVAFDDASGCSTTVDASGRWECVLAGVPAGAGPFRLVAAQAYAAAPGYPAASAPVQFVVDEVPFIPTPPPTPGPSPSPSATPSPSPSPTTTPSPSASPRATPSPEAATPATVSPSSAAEPSGDDQANETHELGGDDGTASGGAPAQRSAEAPPVRPGANGAPLETPLGDGSLLARSGDERGAAAQPVKAATAPPEGLAALPSLTELGSRSLGDHARAAVGALGVILLVLLPGGILESTLAANRARIRRSAPVRRLAQVFATRGARRTSVDEQPAAPEPNRHLTRRLGVAGTLIAGAAMGAAVVPGAFTGPAGLHLFIVFLAASAIVCLVPGFVALLFAGRPGTRAHGGFEAQLWLLPLTTLTVVASRLGGVAPGFVFGLVVGVTLAPGLSRSSTARALRAGVVACLVTGVGAWLLSGSLRDLAGAMSSVSADSVPPPTPLVALVGGAAAAADVLTVVATAALTGPVVSLLPLRFLDGHELRRALPRSWAACTLAAVTTFAFIVAPDRDAWDAVAGDLLRWALIAAAVTLLSLAIWAYFTFVPERPAPAHTGNSTPPSHSASRDTPEPVR